MLPNPCCFEISAKGDRRYTTITTQQRFSRVLPNPCCFQISAEGDFRYTTILERSFTRSLKRSFKEDLKEALKEAFKEALKDALQEALTESFKEVFDVASPYPEFPLFRVLLPRGIFFIKTVFPSWGHLDSFHGS